MARPRLSRHAPVTMKTKLTATLIVIAVLIVFDLGEAQDKNPGRRYSSAQELADDISRFLDNRPTAARPLSKVGRVIRLFRRHPLPSQSARAWDAARGRRSPSCYASSWSRARPVHTGSCRTRGAGFLVEARHCTATMAAWISRSGGGRSAGHSGALRCSTRRRLSSISPE